MGHLRWKVRPQGHGRMRIMKNGSTILLRNNDGGRSRGQGGGGRGGEGGPRYGIIKEAGQRLQMKQRLTPGG